MKTLTRYGCPPKFLNSIVQLNEDQQGQIIHKNGFKQPFFIQNSRLRSCKDFVYDLFQYDDQQMNADIDDG